MADGDVIAYSRSGSSVHVKLTDGATGTTNGVWIDVLPYQEGIIVVTGITTATILIRGSNAATQPADTDAGDYQVGTLTANGVISIGSGSTSLQLMPRWIKGRVSAYTSGTISIIMVARGPTR